MSSSPAFPPTLPKTFLALREVCGLSHDRQVLRIPVSGADAKPILKIAETGERVDFQLSAEHPGSGFVEVEVLPYRPLSIIESEDASSGGIVSNPVSVALHQGVATISNAFFSLEVFLGESLSSAAEWENGPILRFRIGEGPWRGRTFFDVRGRIESCRGELLENGPLRVVYGYAVQLASGGFYKAKITVDRSQTFATIEEDFQTSAGDQVIWDFSKGDLPAEFYLLDSSASYQVRPLFYHLDQRLTRMMCWTQQSQHFGFSDGYAISFGAGENPEIAGFVALEGGEWRGGKLNHLEAWTRRWFPGDPASRRNVPSEAKADGQSGQEGTPGRGQGTCESHFNVEGWIGQGKRKWALVLSTRDRIRPAAEGGEPLGHFETAPSRDRYREQQSLLRKIHTQYGILPLRYLAECDLVWEEEPESVSGFQYPNEILDHHFAARVAPGEAKREMMAFLDARVFGFWEGSGSAYTNPVVSRPLAAEMFRYEWLARAGVFSEEERQAVRAQFAFLMHLFASESYYTGDASMLPVSSPDSLDPTLAGMANQNFYTDVINVFGTGAQIFWKHPQAGRWRGLFLERWRRQLECHMYPESGIWEESHTYYHHVLHTVLPLFLRRREDGAGDEFGNPQLQKLVGSEIAQFTPRDDFAGGWRHVVPFGDHGVDIPRYRYLWRIFAEAFLPHEPVLAGNLAWAYCQMGGEKALPVPATAPAIRNEYLQGLGVMFRGTDARGDESLFALRSGAAWGHHHNDDGSFQFYAGGTALVVDMAFSQPSAGRLKFEAKGHSRWTPKSLEPVNYLWRFNRGWIADSVLDGPLAYAVAYSPVFLVRAGGEPAMPLLRPVVHFRTVVQLAPSAFLIVDTSDSSQEQSVYFHVPGAVQHEGNLAFAKHGEGTLQIHQLAPAAASVQLESHPANPKDEEGYATTSLAFDTGRAPFSAFVVAKTIDVPLQVNGNEGQWVIQGADFTAVLSRGPEGWSICEPGSGVKRAFLHLPPI